MSTKGILFYYRPGTTDEKVIPEVVDRHVYIRKDFTIEPGDYWADIGANIGAFSLLVNQSGARGVAYEPENDNFELLTMNTALNTAGNIALFNCAVTLKGEETVLYTCKSERNKYRHTVLPHRNWQTVSMASVDFNSVLGRGCDCVKMDIEGAELDILDAPINWSTVRKLVFEYHFDVDRSIPSFLKRIERLSKSFRWIYYSKLPGGERYDYFPASKIVYCRV